MTEVDGNLKGSGRSFGDFNLAKALEECKDVIIGGGGHALACGLKLENDKFEVFREKINEYYKSLDLKNQERFFDVKEDVKAEDFSEINLDLIDDMQKLEPFGDGNPEPIILLPDAFILDVTKMGDKEQHLRMLLSDSSGNNVKVVAFNAPKMWLNLQGGARINIWISLMENEWNGVRSVEGRALKISY